MSAWLLSIVGVTVIGVLVELLLTDSPMSKLVRSVYAFFILFVIVRPIPSFFRELKFNLENGNIPVNTELVEEIEQQTRGALIEKAKAELAAAGFDCILTYVGGTVYINAYNSAQSDKEKIISIVTAALNVPASAVEVFI